MLNRPQITRANFATVSVKNNLSGSVYSISRQRLIELADQFQVMYDLGQTNAKRKFYRAIKKEGVDITGQDLPDFTRVEWQAHDPRPHQVLTELRETEGNRIERELRDRRRKRISQEHYKRVTNFGNCEMAVYADEERNWEKNRDNRGYCRTRRVEITVPENVRATELMVRIEQLLAEYQQMPVQLERSVKARIKRRLDVV